MLSSRIAIAIIISSLWMLSAQSPSPALPPIGVKRVPPSAQGQTPTTIVVPGIQTRQ